MEIANITADLLETAFKQWRQAQDPPAELLELDLLGNTHLASKAERAIQLYDYLADLVKQQLTLYRQAEAFVLPDHLPLRHQSLLAELAGDFHVNNATLEAWSILYHRYLAGIQLTIPELTKGASVEERQIRRRLGLGLRLLVDLVRRAEKAAHEQQWVNQRRRHLPPAEHAKLFGAEQSIDSVIRLLLDPATATFISLEGLGGIGKTTLARTVAYQLAEQTYFTDILWIHAKPQRINERGEIELLSEPTLTMEGVFSHLAAQLGLTEFSGMSMRDIQVRLQAIWASHPYLIIVDNLETVEEVSALLPMLSSLAGQSRFLLTSRHTLRYYSFVQTFNVPELSLQDSLAFMRYEIQRNQGRGTLSDSALIKIYATIGGLPLAIRLVTAQIGRLSLAAILDGLHQARAQMPESMYLYIYRRTWQLLGNSARHLLLSMLFISPIGEDANWLGSMSAYVEQEVEQALAELADYSLLEVGGDAERPLYKLHALLIHFCRLKFWPNGNLGNERANVDDGCAARYRF